MIPETRRNVPPVTMILVHERVLMRSVRRVMSTHIAHVLKPSSPPSTSESAGSERSRKSVFPTNQKSKMNRSSSSCEVHGPAGSPLHVDVLPAILVAPAPPRKPSKVMQPPSRSEHSL